MSEHEMGVTQTINFKRMKEYNGWWQLICEPGNEHMNIQMMQRLIKQLARERNL